MLALSALGVSSASAALVFELALWLLNGADLTVADLVDTEGELTLKNVSNGGTIDCSFLAEGTVGPGSEDEITMIYDLAGKLIEELVNNGILCLGLPNCVEEMDAEVWPLHLPWLTELEQDSETLLFYDLSVPNGNGLLPEYHILCLVLGFNVEETCNVVSGSGGEVHNGATGVEGTTTEPVEPLSTCGGNPETGEVLFTKNLTTTETGTLAVSLNASKE